MNIYSDWETVKYDEKKAALIERQLGVSPISSCLLVQRGIDTPEKAQKFFDSSLEELSDPMVLGGVKSAIEHIFQAIADNKKIVVYGDYDVDGICSVVLMKDCFELLHYPLDYYVPGRFEEGYGLNESAIRKLMEKGYNLIITVDCGIKSLKEVEFAASLGMDVIITDHHTPGEILPYAAAIINPKIDGNEKNIDLAGVGVACKLAEALCREKGIAIHYDRWLDLVALATVADIVPLTGDNRIYVKHGLKYMGKTTRIGLKALINAAGIEGHNFTTTQVGYILAPRLNSAGRIANASISIELLLSQDLKKAEELAQSLCKMNDQRRAIEENIFNDAVRQVEDTVDLENERILVLAGEGWHQGVIGIVASRICNKYNRPAVLISWEGDMGKGSGRSIPGFNLYKALVECREYLIQFGGHKLAAGLSIARSSFSDFIKAINELGKEIFAVSDLRRRQRIDLEVSEDDITEDLLNELKLFQPCGEANPVPILALRDVEIHNPTIVGQNHFKAKTGNSRLDTIAFTHGEYIDYPLGICCYDQVFELSENDFRGQRKLQLRLKDMKPSFVPDRQNNSGSFGISLYQALGNCVSEIQRNRPVLMVCPNYRSLYRHYRVLRSIMRPGKVGELHGKLPEMKRMKFEADFARGKNMVFITTTPFLKQYLDKKELPPYLQMVMQVWPDAAGQELASILSKYENRIIGSCIPEIRWIRGSWDKMNTGRVLVYVNRPGTIKRICNNFPNVMVEAGIQDIHERQRIRYQFAYRKDGILLSDGVYSGCNTYHSLFQRLVFADVPFSHYETRLVMEQVMDTVLAEALFSPEDLEFNRNYLYRVYPGPDVINEVADCLLQMHTNPIIKEIKQLAREIEKIVAREFKAFDLLSILYIMVDLGLCQIRKKGSIIEIKLNIIEKSTLDITTSPYYLEGQAEITAFQKLYNELREVLFR